MASTEIGAVFASIRFGYANFYAMNPWPVVLATEWPRSILGSIFVFLLVTQLSHQDATTALASAVMYAMLSSVIANPSDLPNDEKWSGTVHHLRLSRIGVGGSLIARCLPVVTDALMCGAITLVVVAALSGQLDTVPRILSVGWLFVLAAIAGTTAGLACAALSLGRRAEVSIYTALTFLIFAASGMVIPAGAYPWLDAIGSVLPMAHAFDGVRERLDGGTDLLTPALLEVGVIVLWTVVGIIAFWVSSLRARSAGTDAYA